MLDRQQQGRTARLPARVSVPIHPETDPLVTQSQTFCAKQSKGRVRSRPSMVVIVQRRIFLGLVLNDSDAGIPTVPRPPVAKRNSQRATYGP